MPYQFLGPLYTQGRIEGRPKLLELEPKRIAWLYQIRPKGFILGLGPNIHSSLHGILGGKKIGANSSG